MLKLNVVKIQRFSTHDGPGIRTVVFTKGCPLRCAWCHNPETQSALPQIFFRKKDCMGCGACVKVCEHGAQSFDTDGVHRFKSASCTGCLRCADQCPSGAIEPVGKEMAIEEIVEIVKRDTVFYGADGGITLSGGEPMFRAEACIALLHAAKRENMTTAIETSGYFSENYIKDLTNVTDWFLWDLKDGSSARHKQYTGVGNDRILQNLILCDKTAKRIVLRCIMVKGVNMDLTNLNTILKTYQKLNHCGGIELIPYHAYGGSKAEQLGGRENGRSAWIPSNEDMRGVREYLIKQGCHVIGWDSHN